MRRTFSKTRHPGIYAGALPGQKPDRFQVYYRIRGMGQRTKTFERLKDALVFQGKIRAPQEQRKLRQLDAGRIELGTFLKRHMSTSRDWRESTRSRYEIAAKLITEHPIAHLYIAELSREDVERWIDDLLEQGTRPGSYEKAHSLLRSAMASATSQGLTLRNPVLGTKLPERHRREAFVLTAEQVGAIAEDVPEQHRAVVYVLGFLGLRISEAAALQVRDLDLDQGVMHIRRSSAEVGGKLIIGEPKTKSGIRDVQLDDWFCNLLREHLAEFGPTTASGKLTPTGRVFSHAGGGPIRQGNWRMRVFYPACKRQGISRMGDEGQVQLPRVHDLRHSAASIAARSGFLPSDAKQLLGHANVSTTLGIYTHSSQAEQQRLVGNLGSLAKDAANKARGNVVPLVRKKAS